MPKSLQEHFNNNYTINEITNCWEWFGTKNDGYGQITYNGKKFRAHRISYELYIGPIPEGLIVRHTCDNPPCVNPAHLLVGTCTDNSRDMINRGRHRNNNTGKTHCKRGHPFDEANTYYPLDGTRHCIICQKMHSRAFYVNKCLSIKTILNLKE